MLLSGLIVAVIAGLAAAAAIYLLLANSRKTGLVQLPNARSSHTRPTPTGGGMGIALGGTIAGLFVASQTPWPATLIIVLALGIAGLGFTDDFRPVQPGTRLFVQVVLAALATALGVSLFALRTQLGLAIPAVLLFAIATLAVVYWVNLFNFMDGIDGIAASEAAFLLLAPIGLALSTVAGVATEPLFWWFAGLGLSCLVFLYFNWQPAKIFMGDAGSTYLGFMIAILALVTISTGWLSLWEWLILSACFLIDGTVTLLRRLIAHEPIFEAHRRHAYQLLSRRFGAHQPVVIIYAGINIIWLLPLATAAHAGAAPGYWFALIAYLPLVALAFWAGAGRPEHA